MTQGHLQRPVLMLGALSLALAGCGSDGGASDAAVGSDAKTVPDAAVCQQLATTAQTQLASYLQSTGALACAIDADCSMLHLPALSCFAPCGLAVGAAAATAAAAASAGTCDQHAAAGCPGVLVLCPVFHAVCDRGTCTSAFGPADAGAADVPPVVDADLVADAAIDTDHPATIDARPTPDAVVCEQLAATAYTQAVSYLQSSYSLACQADSDCAFLQERSFSCFAVCGNVALRSADLPAATAGIAGVCDPYFGAGCPEKIPPCPYFRPVCDRGACARGGVPGPSVGTDAGVDTGAMDGGI